MNKPPVPANEAKRLTALREYRILDTQPESCYDDIVSLAAAICETPIALMTLVDTDRQWFKAKVGIDIAETHRDLSFCAHAIGSSDAMIVEDATEDARFRDHPMVVGGPKVRFYAGMPLVTDEGYGLGTLCVVDRFPRTLSDHEKDALEKLGRVLTHYLQHRKVADKLAASLRQAPRLPLAIPVCSHCQNLRNEQGEWKSVEVFFGEQLDAKFTRSLCPGCIGKHYVPAPIITPKR